MVTSTFNLAFCLAALCKLQQREVKPKRGKKKTFHETEEMREELSIAPVAGICGQSTREDGAMQKRGIRNLHKNTLKSLAKY